MQLERQTDAELLGRVYHTLTRTVDNNKSIYPDRRAIKRMKGLLTTLLLVFSTLSGALTYGIVEYQRINSHLSNQTCSFTLPFVQNGMEVHPNCSLAQSLSTTARIYLCTGNHSLSYEVRREVDGILIEGIKLSELEFATLQDEHI